VSEQPDGPWLDMSAYPNLAPDDAVPDQVLGVLRDVLRAPEVPPLHPDVWRDVLHGALAPDDHAAGAVSDETHGQQAHGQETHEHDPDAHGHEAHDGHWPVPGGAEHTWHGPGTGLHDGGLGGHGSGADGPHDDGFHDGGSYGGGGHG